jgi:hypothetical protein
MGGHAAEEGVGGGGGVGRLGVERPKRAHQYQARKKTRRRRPPEESMVRSIHSSYSLR